MEVNVTPPPPPPPPPSTYDLTGLTEDEARFLRDLCGRFSCNPPRGEDAHFHTRLFTQLDAALRDAHNRTSYVKHRFKTTGGSYDHYDPTLQCQDRVR
jgi:hypothetical protein